MYSIYHIKGEKVGATQDVASRVKEQQGCLDNEFEVLLTTDSVEVVSELEIYFQKKFGYKVDPTPYSRLVKKMKKSKPSVSKTYRNTTATTTFKVVKKDLTVDFLLGSEINTKFGVFNVETEEQAQYIIANSTANYEGKPNCFIYNRLLRNHFGNELPKPDQKSFKQRLHTMEADQIAETL